MSTIQLTPQGHQTLQKELDKLQNHKRPALVDRLAYARSQGDLSENSDYQNARQELEMLDNRIADIQITLNQAKVIQKASTGQVSLGHHVTVEVGSAKKTFEIVSQFEANPAKGKISSESPIGNALMGKKPGDQVKIQTPSGTTAYTILKIE